jgi:hypothetical protein
LRQKKLQSQTVFIEKLSKTLSYEKGMHKMLIYRRKGPIAPTFYVQLLHAKILKAQKRLTT